MGNCLSNDERRHSDEQQRRAQFRHSHSDQRLSTEFNAAGDEQPHYGEGNHCNSTEHSSNNPLTLFRPLRNDNDECEVATPECLANTHSSAPTVQLLSVKRYRRRCRRSGNTLSRSFSDVDKARRGCRDGRARLSSSGNAEGVCPSGPFLSRSGSPDSQTPEGSASSPCTEDDVQPAAMNEVRSSSRDSSSYSEGRGPVPYAPLALSIYSEGRSTRQSLGAYSLRSGGTLVLSDALVGNNALERPWSMDED